MSSTEASIPAGQGLCDQNHSTTGFVVSPFYGGDKGGQGVDFGDKHKKVLVYSLTVVGKT